MLRMAVLSLLTTLSLVSCNNTSIDEVLNDETTGKIGETRSLPMNVITFEKIEDAKIFWEYRVDQNTKGLEKMKAKGYTSGGIQVIVQERIDGTGMCKVTWTENPLAVGYVSCDSFVPK